MEFDQKKIDKIKEVIKLPISSALNMVIFHTFLAVFIFNLYLDNLTVVESIYFNFVAIATVGFGDIYPKPKNTFDAFFIILFISLGIVFLSCFFVSGCLKLEELLFKRFTKFLARQNFGKLRSLFKNRKLECHKNSKNEVDNKV